MITDAKGSGGNEKPWTISWTDWVHHPRQSPCIQLNAENVSLPRTSAKEIFETIAVGEV